MKVNRTHATDLLWCFWSRPLSKLVTNRTADAPSEIPSVLLEVDDADEMTEVT